MQWADQRSTAQQIIDQEGEFVLGLKGNQGTTLIAVDEHFSTISEDKSKAYYEADKGHGRIEEKTYLAVDANSIIDMKEWPGLKSVFKVISVRQIKDKMTTEHRFYLSSLVASSVKIRGDAIRSRLGIENALYYVLDVTFWQDKSRIRNGNAPENFGIRRHLAMNILHGAPEAKKVGQPLTSNVGSPAWS